VPRSNVVVPPALQAASGAAAGNGQAAIYLVQADKALAVYAVADAIREGSPETIAALHERGIEVDILTGDAQAVADAVAKELGIDTVFAEVLPDDNCTREIARADQGFKNPYMRKTSCAVAAENKGERLVVACHQSISAHLTPPSGARIGHNSLCAYDSAGATVLCQRPIAENPGLRSTHF